jgi:hypothetical protein
MFSLFVHRWHATAGHSADDPPQPPAIHHVVSELEALGYRWAQRVIGLTAGATIVHFIRLTQLFYLLLNRPLYKPQLSCSCFISWYQ